MLQTVLSRYALIVLSFTTYFLASASAQATPSDITPTQENVTLRFSMLQDPGEEGNIQRFVEAFNEKYPNITVVLEPISGDYEQRLILQAASRTLPDLFWASDQGVQVLGSRNLMLNLDPYIAASGLDTSNFYESMLDLGKVNGVQYMLPRDYNHLVTYYNVDMFEAAGVPLPTEGWSWTEFVEAAEALTVKDDSGATTQYGVEGSNFNWWAIVVPAIRGFGGEVVTEEGEVVVNSPEAAAGVEALAKLVADGVATNFAESDPETFINGQTAMWFHVRPLVQVINDTAQDKFRWDVATFPAFPEQHRVGTGTSGYGIYANTAHPNEAWALLSFIVSEEGQRIFSSTGNAVPVLKSLAEDPVWTSVPREDLAYEAFTLYPEADTLPLEPRLPAGAAGAVNTARETLMEEVMLGTTTPADMVARWGEEIQLAIEQAQ